jgi:hypothetical protein
MVEPMLERKQKFLVKILVLVTRFKLCRVQSKTLESPFGSYSSLESLRVLDNTLEAPDSKCSGVCCEFRGANHSYIVLLLYSLFTNLPLHFSFRIA